MTQGSFQIFTRPAAGTPYHADHARLDARRSPRPGVLPLLAGAIYILGSSWALWKKLTMDPKSGLWLVAVAAITMVAYLAARILRRAPRF